MWHERVAWLHFQQTQRQFLRYPHFSPSGDFFTEENMRSREATLGSFFVNVSWTEQSAHFCFCLFNKVVASVIKAFTFSLPQCRLKDRPAASWHRFWISSDQDFILLRKEQNVASQLAHKWNCIPLRKQFGHKEFARVHSQNQCVGHGFLECRWNRMCRRRNRLWSALLIKNKTWQFQL